MSEFIRNCPNCGKEIFYISESNLKRANKNNRKCQTCSQRKFNHGYNLDDNTGSNLIFRISDNFMNRLVKSAIKRNHIFDLGITKDYLYSLAVDQNFKCVFSGYPLNMKTTREISASLDRIDNKKGYVKGNLHWVHKDLNMMRGGLSIERFKELCEAVVNNQK